MPPIRHSYPVHKDRTVTILPIFIPDYAPMQPDGLEKRRHDAIKAYEEDPFSQARQDIMSVVSAAVLRGVSKEERVLLDAIFRLASPAELTDDPEWLKEN